MPKTYFNHAIIGNSSTLACITDKGEMTRLFWPHIDYPQHLNEFCVGVYKKQYQYSTQWLHEDDFSHSQAYIEDTNILSTRCESRDGSYRAVQTDYAMMDQDVIIRQYEIENTGTQEIDLGFVAYSSCISTNSEFRSSLFDFHKDALIHYRHGYYVSISADVEACQFQLGNDAKNKAKMTQLHGVDAIGMMQDGAVTWQLGRMQPGEKKKIALFICLAKSLKGVKELTQTIKKLDLERTYQATKQHWLDFVQKARTIQTGKADVDQLYKRSLLVFSLMSDQKTGGLMAAPEIDEEFTQCGRYAYCWGRDAAFITGALDKCGLSNEVDRFYRWALDIQEEDGSWLQRYYMDGNLAPSWGLQVDETGTLIWGMLQHYKETKDQAFLKDMWESIQKGADFLCAFIDPDTHLPSPSYDLWEERIGEHAYSSAAVYGGLMAAAEVAALLAISKDRAMAWTACAHSIKDAMLEHLWKEDWHRFVRSIRVKLNPWGEENSSEKIFIKVNPKGCVRDFTPLDGVIDISMVGISVPFDVLAVDDPRMVSTVYWVENNLTCQNVGGIKRYEHDQYIGGNPWVLATLWVALYHIKKKNYEKAREYFYWAVGSRTSLDLLPEQVDKENGKPAWVIPLTWSHAMFVLTLDALLEAGEL